MSIDRNIQTSLHGRRLGLSKDNNLISADSYGRPTIIGLNSSSPSQRVVWNDDFIGDAILTPYNFQEGSDTSTSDFAILAGGIGGFARMTTGDSATLTMAGNGAQVDLGALNWKPNKGGLVFDSWITTDAITTVAFFMGFTDQVAALEMPWTLSTTTYTSNQSDGCGFLFDTAATTDTIRCVGVKGDVDATAVDTSNAWATATATRFTVRADDDGYARYYINGALVATIANAFTTTVALTPVIAAFARATTAVNFDIDNFYVAQDR